MGFYTGRTGSLLLGDKVVAKIRDWSIEATVELLSTNDISSSANTFTPGRKGATGSATLIYYRLDAVEIEAGLVEFTEVLSKIMTTGDISSTALAFKLKVGSGLAEKPDHDTIEFNAFITSASVSTATGELAVVPINFTVDGEFAKVIKLSTAIA